MKTNRIRFNTTNTTRYAVICVISALLLFPYFWMVTTSLKIPSKIFLFPPQWLPNPIRLSNYVELFERSPFHKYMWNSIYVSTIVTVGTCILATIAGYAFARLKFPFRDGLFILLLSGMMIPTEVISIPLYLAFSRIGLVNTMFPLTVPQFFSMGGIFGVFLLRQFFKGIPIELDEAACIDGCSPIMTFFRIALPLAKSAIASLVIYTFLTSWNEYFLPLIYLNTNRLYTIPLALNLFTTESGTDWHLVMAAAVISTLPLLTVFYLMQKRFIESLAMSGIK